MSTDYEKLELGWSIALWSVATSGVLAVAIVGMGIFSGSASVIAIGAEFAGDVLASAAVIAGMTLAARPIPNIRTDKGDLRHSPDSS